MILMIMVITESSVDFIDKLRCRGSSRKCKSKHLIHLHKVIDEWNSIHLLKSFVIQSASQRE